MWGPPGPEQAARRARNEPLLTKPITSELGAVSPVLVVPGPWDERRLAFQAESVAGAVTHNASFNCNAAKLLVTPRGWGLRGRFLDLLMAAMAKAPARRAWYPGAAERYRALTAGRAGLRTSGPAPEGTLPWTLLPDLDAASPDVAFTTEPFCALLSETSVGSPDPLEYLEAATAFANDRVWGSLSCTVLVHPATAADPTTGPAVERAIRRLRYGSVNVNVWAGYAFAIGSAPWGAFPGHTLRDVGSGIGFVHNTSMLTGIEKCVLRQPAWNLPKPVYFPSHRTAQVVGRRLVELESGGGWASVPGVAAAAVMG